MVIAMTPPGVVILGGLTLVAGLSCMTQDKSTPSRRTDLVEQLKDDVVCMLRSRDCGWVAHGAHRAGLHRLSGTAPELLQVLRRYRSDPSMPGRLVRLLATDALVEVGAQLSANEARALDTENAPIPSVVLLSRNPTQHLERLRQIHDAQETGPAGDVWRATGNLLAGEKVPGFAAKLMSAFQMQLEITVVRPGNDPWGRAVGVGLGGAGGYWASGPAPCGFPRLPYYSLTRLPEAGDIVLAPGKTPVYYRRTLMEAGRFEQNLSEDSFRSDLTRLAWIETMAGTRVGVLGFQLESWQEIEFESETSYCEAVRECHAARERAWNSLIQELVAAHALSREEAARLPPRIDIVIRDERDPPGGQLPCWKDDR